MAVPIYQPPTKQITIRGSAEPLKVHGLSFEDVTALVNDHLPEIVDAFESYKGTMTDVYTQRSMDSFMGSLLKGFPMLTAHLIAHAADAPDDYEVIAKYPIGVQTVALAAIAELTLEDAGGLKDPSPALGQALKQVLGALSSRTTALPGSTGPSGGQ